MENNNKKIIDSLKLNSKDVGSSEVQIGLLSEKINNLTNHFKKNKNDKHSTRGLLFAVNQRKKLLEYLKSNNSESYKNILTKFSYLVRKALSKKIDMKFLPKVSFVSDKSFDYAEKIEKLIQKNKL